MTGKERVALAMNLKTADRVPVFCQLSLGHYMIHTPCEPHMIWFSPQAFAESLVILAEKYNFDGILVNLPGRQRDWENHIAKKEEKNNELIIYWDNNSYSVCPSNDNVHNFSETRVPAFKDVNPHDLFYIEPHDITGIDHPYTYGFSRSHGPHNRDFFPEYLQDTIKNVVKISGERFHISSEVFSPFTQFLELFGYTDALIALMEDPDKCEEMLENLSLGAAELAVLQAGLNIDAVLVSSAFAGGGFISRDFYRQFVLPYEKHIVDRLHRESKLPIYVHTCGNIGDRIDLMFEAGYDGIDTMDPPPLGNTAIEEVKEKFGKQLFLKGNLDPVNVLLKGSKEDVYKKAEWLINHAGQHGGYILSTACSVAPQASPENIEQLYLASEADPYQ